MSDEKAVSDQTETPEQTALRPIGFLDGKYPPMSLEDFNAYNEEIASWFYDGSIYPEEHTAEEDKLRSSSSPYPRTD